MKHFLYALCQWTWGFSQTLIGAIMFLMHHANRHFSFHGATVTLWKHKSSVSLGKFIFLTDDPRCYCNGIPDGDYNQKLLVHEYGHTIQSLILGPFYLLAIGLPSLLWAGLPLFEQLRRKHTLSYFWFYCEINANALGEAVTHAPSVGLFLPDTSR